MDNLKYKSAQSSDNNETRKTIEEAQNTKTHLQLHLNFMR